MPTVKSLLKDIANSIRKAEGSTAQIPAPDFPQRIEAISKGIDVSGVTATESTVLQGVTFIDASGELKSGTIVNRGSYQKRIATAEEAHVLSAGYYTGGTVRIQLEEAAKIIPSNIRKGVTILGVEGTANIVGSPYDCRVLIGEPSSDGTNIVVSGLSNVANIQHIYMSAYDKAPDDKVIGVWGQNLSLSSGGTAAVTIYSGEKSYADNIVTKEESVTASFDGSNLTIPLNGNVMHEDIKYTIIATPIHGENTSAVFSGSFSPKSADDDTAVFMAYNLDECVEKLTTITGIYIEAPSILIGRGQISLSVGGTATVYGLEVGDDSKDEISNISVCTATFDGVYVTLVFNKKCISVGNSIRFTIVGK